MLEVYWAGILGIIAGIITAIISIKYIIKYKAKTIDDKGNYLVLTIPLLGHIQTQQRIKYSGIFLDDWDEFKRKQDKLSKLLDPEIIYHYANEYDIHYIGFEGDESDESWSESRLAYTEFCETPDGRYDIFLCPQLEAGKISNYLSQELGEKIKPSEVQLFLFLHEIGHNPKTGNQSYFTAVVNQSLYGDRRSSKRRQKLKQIQNEIEKFSDNFALKELKKFRSSYHQDSKKRSSKTIINNG